MGCAYAEMTRIFFPKQVCVTSTLTLIQVLLCNLTAGIFREGNLTLTLL